MACEWREANEAWDKGERRDERIAFQACGPFLQISHEIDIRTCYLKELNSLGERISKEKLRKVVRSAATSKSKSFSMRALQPD